MHFFRKVREWRLQINNIHVPAPKQCKNFMHILPHKQTVWTRLPLTQSFNQWANITKQLFCFQLACKVCQKSQTRAQVGLFCQQTQPSSQRAGIWPHCILGNMSFLWAGKTYLQPISCFFRSLWPGFNNTLKVFQSLPSLIETFIIESWSLLRQGSFALWPLVHELQTASSWNRASGRSLSHSQCQ